MFCPHCGKEVADTQSFCQFCGGSLAGHASGIDRDGRGRTAWEDRSRLGGFRGLVATLRSSLFNPSEFFRRMNVTGGLADPMLYALIVGMAGVMTFYFWHILLQGIMPAGLSQDVRGLSGMSVFSGIGLAMLAVLTPFFIIAYLFLWAGFLHLLLLMVQGAKNGFEATFRTVAYSHGTNIFLLIPFCGGLIAAVWGVVIVIIGLKESHGTSGGKAAFAVLFPVIFCCAASAILMLVLLGAAATSLGALSSQPWK